MVSALLRYPLLESGQMSKLAERIRRAGRAEPAPIGFAAAAARTRAPSILCVVWLSANDANKAGDAFAKGADAVILEGADARKVKDAVEKAENGILGVRPDPSGAGRKAAAELREAGADFVLLDASVAAEVLLEDKLGYVLTPPTDADDTTLRLLGDMPLDAMVVPAPELPLTLEKLLGLRRLAGLSRTPLLTEVAPDAEASVLESLREAGVVGVIVDGSGIGKLGGLKERIEGLPPRGRRRETAEAMLPVQAAASHDDYDDEEE
jgi:hypothetical protein